MRPTIIHLIDDTKLGGVNLALESLAASRLNQLFAFKLVHRRFSRPSFRRYTADIILLHGAVSWRKLPAFLALKLANIGTPILYQEHHYSREFARYCVKSPWRFRLMLRLGYGLMDKVLLVSNAQADWLEELRVLPKEKMARVGQAKELSRFLSLPEKAVVTPLILLAYGRLSQQKGFELLIKAMAKLPSYRVKLILAGEGELLPVLSALAKPLSHVHLVGEVLDVPKFLAAGDVVIIPSRWEPFGLTCLEAIAAGKGVIAANIDGLSDQLAGLQQQGNGYQIIDELTVAGIESAINHALSGERLKINAAQRLSSAQAWESVLERWQQLLEGLLNRRK
ncbi:glycosyl transferase group 1 [Shewanella halifaxensis HAW-EB4]|uniref:Glycosyl transferase group 1 n=1 Tax=Shewanella halifaxensis (strain HAW-EB4) TaxID=458817 RepID=B0TTC5_SHEHH|nr:glycosyltransferase family 4 protein [Shewanella halifaxensis]ABZ78066.1 glycosyl transferase group 1 [Shewanella halifaxensis HAW-EB4]